MRPNKPTQQECHPKRPRQADEDRLRELPYRLRIDKVENYRRHDPSRCMQKPHRTQHLTSPIGRDMFRQSGRQCRRAHPTDRGDGAAEYEERARADGGVTREAQHIEENGEAYDSEIELVGAGVSLRGLAPRATDQASRGGEEDDEGDDSATVDNGDEDAGLEGVPAEHEFGVEECDG